MKLQIKEPCHESWDNMKIGLISRHCDVCEKGVMDFTKMNRGEIIAYMLSNPNDNVCGRMNKDQFDFQHDDIPILIEAIRKSRPSNSFMILALVCLSLASCSEEPKGNIDVPPAVNDHTEIVIDSGSSVGCGTLGELEIDTNEIDFIQTKKGEVELDPNQFLEITTGEIAVSGGICVVDPPIVDPPIMEPDSPQKEEDQIHQFADKMPEFNGGMDELFKFIKDNLQYPQFEKENDIQGNVYVRFVVEKDGSITQPEILRSVKGSKNLDKEVLRVIGKMPKWIPAVHKEKEVRAYMALPVRFQLKD